MPVRAKCAALTVACALLIGACSTAPPDRKTDATPQAPDVPSVGGAPESGVPDPSAPEGDDAPEATRREVRELWTKFRALLLKNERDAAAYKGLVDEPDGFDHLEQCLAEEVDLGVEWLRMSTEDLQKAEARFRFYLDRDECNIYFTGLDVGDTPELLVRRIDGRWVIWPQRG
ncbi:MAG: hypothetical protein ACYTKD_27640 [Planctomycetota bacterium]|jgi:hypothetical protein